MKAQENVVVKNHQVILNRGLYRLAAPRKVVIRSLIDRIQDRQRLTLQFLNNLRGWSRIKYGMASLFNNNPEAGDPRQKLLGMTANKIAARGFVPYRHPELDSGSSRFVTGFTLIELLVVVLIIGILAAVAVPQYQKAVLKIRYSALMPIAKSMANSNEVYYMEHGSYASTLTQLDVTGQEEKYPDGTQVDMSRPTDTSNYVRATTDSVPNARYVVYQKHSENFAGTTLCEAADDRTQELCQALGGQLVGDYTSDGVTWTAYLLSGTYSEEDSLSKETDTHEEENESEDDNTDTPSGQETTPAKAISSQYDCSVAPWPSCTRFNFTDGTQLRVNRRPSTSMANYDYYFEIGAYVNDTENSWRQYDKDGNCIKMNEKRNGSWGVAQSCSEEPNCNEKFAGYNVVCNLYN